MSLLSDAPTLALDFQMTESGAPITELADSSAYANTLPVAGVVTLAEGSDPGINVKAYAFNSALGASLPDISAYDWAMITAFKSVSGGVGSYDNGSGSFYLNHIRLQPYCVSFYVGSASETTQISTPVIPALLRRTEGQVYCIAAARRGSMLEHWVDGQLMASIDTNLLLDSIASTNEAAAISTLTSLYDTWNDFTFSPSAIISLGHAAYDVLPTTYGTDGNPPPGFDAGSTGVWYPHLSESLAIPGHYEVPGTWYQYDTYAGQVMNLAQDVLFAKVLSFPNGMTAHLGQAMNWMKEQAILGNKKVWPGLDGAILQTPTVVGATFGGEE